MNNDAKEALDARYRNLFGWIAGYLPRNRAAVDEWHKNLKQQLEEARSKGETRPHSKAVKDLAALIEANGIVRMYVDLMIKEVFMDLTIADAPISRRTIENIEELLEALNHITHTAPLYSSVTNDQNFFPMSTLFVYMMMTSAGEAAFRNEAFNGALRNILTEWCCFLDSPNSQCVLNEGESGWLSPSAYKYSKLDEFIIPDRSALHWGWASFNDYFHRQIKPECRPIAEPNNRKVIVSANDGTVFWYQCKVNALDTFWLKGEPYSLSNMFNNSAYTESFVGGDVFQSFLSGADYHRWRSPIDGVVQHAEVVDGLMFSELKSAGRDKTAGTYSQRYEASVNTRGLVFIKSDDPVIGMVCVMPIGITEISSVTIQVQKGDQVKKGDELGYFSYGGSSMCLVFQPGAIDHFTVPRPPPGGKPDHGQPIKVNAQIAVAK